MCLFSVEYFEKDIKLCSLEYNCNKSVLEVEVEIALHILANCDMLVKLRDIGYTGIDLKLKTLIKSTSISYEK